MRERCPTCGVRFDRRPEEAFFLGAFVIQTALILTPLAALLFLFVWRQEISSEARRRRT